MSVKLVASQDGKELVRRVRWKPGTTVALKSGGPVMTVEKLGEDAKPPKPGERYCVWFSDPDDQACSGWFFAHTLMRPMIEPEKPSPPPPAPSQTIIRVEGQRRPWGKK